MTKGQIPQLTKIFYQKGKKKDKHPIEKWRKELNNQLTYATYVHEPSKDANATQYLERNKSKL